MSWILAVETSTEWCSVALGRLDADGTLACLSRHEHTGARSSSRVLPAAGELLAEAGIALADCAAIAFGAGPGSFTGLRTACGVAQGLAFGASLPVVPVNTLMACAERARRDGPPLPDGTAVLVALDARMDEAYTGAFAWRDGRWHALTAMQVGPPETVALPAGPYWLAGNAAEVFGERLAGLGGAQRVASDAMPDARAVAALAFGALARGEAVEAAEAMPIYLRDKVAQTIAEREAAAALRAAGSRP
ncbi:tRNA (adenosine(37)-N6)-threonylcarbamoyltransferase complex dimerization subunit type 1 TsaB [Cupriavidus sp. USMAA2-4]|uniref:tRNA (adenosine(37)-N6)-threonylcarbamoyltransferase complex dimerization subunit type 1 TsaB n=1 Tax=unclassified Cupriavidus TaxID=2640874 RepID=UPI0008A6B25E|nr:MULTISPECIES: tRNA (adenosine(37)-N6)-threonylcarbamoyltransferase complex dimerization subunit type 1 TsaB [unclassified Cupriavidus]AOY90945.1 tRNA (adenosine(37)-N6)-threonylcarbamoyltransferase complex dimerization subunit type 1 TsaB [Cupriavidus sp. USMAA2-4]AOY99483.1 tRNA (adenosine(37)-N6)-threonylcarbamoyltransferase complex dimerization subunit type 1 TsaB [Cupriavidus sp. USMAHM13]